MHKMNNNNKKTYHLYISGTLTLSVSWAMISTGVGKQLQEKMRLYILGAPNMGTRDNGTWYVLRLYYFEGGYDNDSNKIVVIFLLLLHLS